MTNLLFSPPWWLVATLVGIGLIVAWNGNKRSDGRTRTVGLGLVALAVVLFTVGWFVETDVERVTRLNREMIQSVPNQDWSKFASLLDPDATLGIVSMTSLYPNRAAIIDGAKADVSRWNLKSVGISHTEARQDASGITVDVNVFTHQDAGIGIDTAPSSWRMIWDQTDKQWHCHQIICLSIGNQSTSNIGNMLK